MIISSVGNGIVLCSAFACQIFLERRGQPGQPRIMPWLSVALILATSIVTALQYIHPEVLAVLRRDADGLREGELWRLVSPLFVQAKGPMQLVYNILFMIAFLPLAEKLYGRGGMLAIYFISGIAGQLVNHVWDPTGGGPSTAVFGVMGGIVAYVLFNRSRFPALLSVAAALSLVGAVVICFVNDGHGPGLLTGAVVATVLMAARRLG
jgi:rhomboid protease GluP